MTNDTTPTCSCGQSDVVKNVANHKEFFYCRGCKKEPSDNAPLEISWTDIQKRIDEAINGCTHAGSFNGVCYACGVGMAGQTFYPSTSPVVGPCQHLNVVWDASGNLQCPDCNRFWTP